MDQDLNFNAHKANLYKNLCLRWVTICRYTSRNWGLNQKVMVRLGQTLLLSSMFYAGIIWMREGHLEKLEKLWYKLLKTSIGAVFNISQITAEIILGIPPLKILNRVNTTKHYLKINIQTWIGPWLNLNRKRFKMLPSKKAIFLGSQKRKMVIKIEFTRPFSCLQKCSL